MKIFITNLGRYNEGYLVGKWVKLPVCEDVLDKVLKEIGIDNNKGLVSYFDVIVKYVAPVCILAILISGLFITF